MGAFSRFLHIRRVEEDPGTSVRRIATAEGICIPLAGKFSMNSHFTHTTSSKCKPHSS
jgi:hypothetical protein